MVTPEGKVHVDNLDSALDDPVKQVPALLNNQKPAQPDTTEVTDDRSNGIEVSAQTIATKRGAIQA